MKRVAFRVDASSHSGAGHLTRCTTLARELARRSVDIVFAIRTDVPQYCESLRAHGFDVRMMSERSAGSEALDQEDFLRCTADCGSFDWIVVDHYELAASWETAVRHRAHRIFVIDDLVGRLHDCDLLLDQNVVGGREPPPADLAAPKILAGPRYALLGLEFARLRRESPRTNASTQSVLICFGGADPRDHTSAAVEALAPLCASRHVTVVLGAANPNVAAVERACRKLRDHDLLVAPPDLPSILAKTSLAIGAGGTMAWERACLGVPAVAFGIAPNQVRALESLFDAGCALGLAELFEPDVDAIRSCIAVALGNATLMAGMSRRASAIVDGNGARRVVDVMLPSAVTFRVATMADGETIFNWRNDAAVRSVSMDSSEILPETHRLWMQAITKDASRALLVAECSGQPVGIVRFDLNGDAATISIYRAPASEERRLGLIPRAVEWLADNRPDIRRIVAEVKSDNTTSLRAFGSAGFVEKKRVLERDIGR